MHLPDMKAHLRDGSHLLSLRSEQLVKNALLVGRSPCALFFGASEQEEREEGEKEADAKQEQPIRRQRRRKQRKPSDLQDIEEGEHKTRDEDDVEDEEVKVADSDGEVAQSRALKRCTTRLSGEKRDIALVQLCRVADLDRNGHLNHDEFATLMRALSDELSAAEIGDWYNDFVRENSFDPEAGLELEWVKAFLDKEDGLYISDGKLFQALAMLESHMNLDESPNEPTEITVGEEFSLGQHVRCRDEGGDWLLGVVRSIQPLQVQLDDGGTNVAFEWDEVVAAQARAHWKKT